MDRPLDMESEKWGSPPWCNSILRSWKGKRTSEGARFASDTANLPGTLLVSFLLGGCAGSETGISFQRVVPTDAGLCLRWKVHTREPGKERWEWGPLFKMNKGPAFRYLETSSPGMSQYPVAGNFWSSLWTTNTHGVQMVIFRMLLCFFHPVFIRPYPLPHCIFFFHSASSSCSASPTALTGFSASILFPLGPSFQGTELCFLLPHRSSRAFLWVGRKDFISELAKSRPLDQNKSTNTFYFCLHNVLISFN